MLSLYDFRSVKKHVQKKKRNIMELTPNDNVKMLITVIALLRNNGWKYVYYFCVYIFEMSGHNGKWKLKNQI